MNVRPGSETSWQREKLFLEEIWLFYFGVGGAAGLLELEAFIYGIEVLGEIDLMLLECALYEAAPP